MDINWNIMKERLSKYNNSIVTNSFASAVSTTMPRTFLLGNGDIGIISDGSKDKKEYRISKGDFWSAGDLATDAPMALNTRRMSHITFGGISFEGFSEGKFSECLDITNGKLKTLKGGITFEAVCLQDSNALVVKMNCARDTTFRVKLWAKDDVNDYPASVFSSEDRAFVCRKTANFAKENPRSWTSVICATVDCLGGEFAFSSYGDNYAEYSLKLFSDRDAYFILAIGGGGQTLGNNDELLGIAPDIEARNLINRLLKLDDLKAMLFDSELWWQDYWMRSFVSLSDIEIEKYYYGSMYLMACFSRNGKRATGLYGNFVTTDNPKWQNDFHMNYNFIAPLYGAYASNRCDFAAPLIEPLLEYIPEGKKRAKEDLRKVSKAYIDGGMICRMHFKGRRELKNGIENAVLYSVGLAPYGFSSWNDKGGYLTQMYDAAFTATCITTYYSYTLDGEYLRKTVELLRLIVNFYVAWREKEVKADGEYRYNIWSGAHEGTMEMNSPGVLGAIKSILSCLLKGAKRGDIEATKNELLSWNDFMDHIADYPIKQYTVRRFLKRTFDKPIVLVGERGLEISVGQTIALEFIHPCYDMNFLSDEKLRQASRNVLELYKFKNSKVYSQINAFPKNFTHAIMCGVSADVVTKEFKEVLDSQFRYNYSVDDGNVHGVEKCGATEFIHAMLLDSDGEVLRLFPNIIENKDYSFKTLRASGAFLVSADYNGKTKAVTSVEIVSEKQNSIQMVSPYAKPIVMDEDGTKIYFECKKIKSFDVIKFEAILGKKYTIRA